VVVGQTLATRPEDTYRALLEATAFGTRTIIEAFAANGVPVTEFVVAGGLVKNAFLMQMYADITRLQLSVIGSAQAPALGSAIFAAVAAGIHPDVRVAAQAMGKVERAVYLPDEERAKKYDALYAEYVRLHDWFGRGGNDVLHRLHAIRQEAVVRRGADLQDFQTDTTSSALTEEEK
jgi:L-ribulokinase